MFVSFDVSEASELTIEYIHNQYLYNQQITVQHAFKKVSSTGEDNDMVAKGGNDRGIYQKGMVIAPAYVGSGQPP